MVKIIPENIITVDKNSVRVKLSFKKIILIIIDKIGANSWIIPTVNICILGNTAYQITYPNAEVITPEKIAKNSVYESKVIFWTNIKANKIVNTEAFRKLSFVFKKASLDFFPKIV